MSDIPPYDLVHLAHDLKKVREDPQGVYKFASEMEDDSKDFITLHLIDTFTDPIAFFNLAKRATLFVNQYPPEILSGYILGASNKPTGAENELLIQISFLKANCSHLDLQKIINELKVFFKEALICEQIEEVNLLRSRINISDFYSRDPSLEDLVVIAFLMS